jgi:hypothetical protein
MIPRGERLFPIGRSRPFLGALAMQWRMIICGCLIVASASGCTDRANTLVRPEALNTRYVTGRAAAALNSHGQFILSPKLAADEIPEATAVDLGDAYVHTFGKWFATLYSIGAGVPVNPAALTPCGRAFYSASLFDRPAGSMSTQLKRYVGGHWLVQLCETGTPRVAVAVSALSANLVSSARRLIGDPTQTFSSDGVRSELAGAYLSPEEAVNTVGNLSGRSTVEVPELLMPPLGSSPIASLWHLTLDAPLAAKDRRGIALQTREVYVGLRGARPVVTIFAADESGIVTEIRDVPPNHDALGATIRLASVAGRPRSFKAIEVTP